MKVLVIRRSLKDLNNRFNEIIKQEEKKKNSLKYREWIDLKLKFENDDEYHGYIIYDKEKSYVGLMSCSRNYDDIDSDQIPGEIRGLCDYYLHIRPLTRGKNKKKLEENIKKHCKIYK